MREEESSNWFTNLEQQLPSQEELIPLSQSLITPNLAIAFDLQTTNTNSGQQQQQQQQQTNSTAAAESSGGGEEQARTVKRQRLVWTPQLHKRFVDAVAHLGIKNAVPKTIMQFMRVEGLTRENVASHLQKYRLYLKRMQSGAGNVAGGVGDSDHLFANSHVPPQFLLPISRQNSDQFMPSFVPISSLQQHQHHQQHQSQFLHRGISAVNFTSPVNNGKVMDQSLFLARQNQQQQVFRPQVANYTEDLVESRTKPVLTLFPTRTD
ncbi:hypothetical protein AALP_AA8G204000 [Arabis alpina]|uniref:HTH myb-type domain-containing protein n=1 Tax=Arabis alpina TaxID=50452 RepID=A0A087G8A8_ARAAL|nr:hypothetical protein AALP_AA8G204000 [Arabis alpina]